MTHVFHRNPRQNLNSIVRGQRIELFDREGKSYIDASGGAAVSCLGHGHPVVVDEQPNAVRLRICQCRPCRRRGLDLDAGRAHQLRSE